MARIETRVGPLHVERHGNPGGPTLVCWPSLFCDGRTLQPLVDELGRDHQLVLIDGPGHGKSGGVTHSFTMEDSADAAIEILNSFAIGKVTWVGSAWGGHVGTVAALRHRDRILGLVTMNAPLGAWTGRSRAMNWSLYWMFRLFNRPRWLARQVAAAMLSPARRAERPELAEPIIDCIVRSERAPFFAAVRSAMIERPSLVPRLPEIRVPTLFITGAEDGLFPVEIARAQAALIPGARFEVIAGSAHLSVWETPQSVLPTLRAFISEVTSARAA